ncbi:MAG TPA: hypothetical protein VNO75_01340 [Gemmatimonadaceae bacterium]|nr:hypothetical protein [Gemmatimonadaceae bacterium]
MNGFPRRLNSSLRLALVVSAACALGLHAQERPAGASSRDTTLAANPDFRAGGLQRFFMGDNYRDEWTTPITVPFLDLRAYGGGLRATETGGGFQTLNLRLEGRDGREYVFRPVRKGVSLPDVYRRTIIWDIIADGRSSLHPVSPLPGAPMLAAVGVLHPLPQLFVMPNDPLLGEFREVFAGQLGTMEERPDDPEGGRGFAGAMRILNSEELLERINANPLDRVDARAVLTARFVDMLLNDNDRHPDQWAWARFTNAPDAPWIPITRDRDKVLHSEEGLIMSLAGMIKPSIMSFDSAYPKKVRPLISQALELDRRLLGGLEWPVWDSIAASVVRRISDPVIEASVRRMPREYSFSFPEIAGKLRARRDSIPTLARKYYAEIAQLADIHGTDADEWATVTRFSDGFVDVGLQAGNRAPHFRRRFDPRETSEIRIYLHGGNDVGIVRGDIGDGITVRIIGGDGTNRLVDSTEALGGRNRTFLYESGTVRGTRYDGDGLDTREIDDSQLRFNRLPWALAYGDLAPPQTDRGGAMKPYGSIGSGHGLGLVPRIGIARYKYGFRMVPYKSMTAADVAYSTRIKGFEINVGYDRRFESSAMHMPVTAGMSQLDVVDFGGFGNDLPEPVGEFFDVRQRAWSFRPAIGVSPNSRSDISLGPIVRYTSTDDTPNRFISQLAPYGFDSFGQAGLQLQLQFDTRGSPELFEVGGRNVLVGLGEGDRDPTLWGKLTFGASAYPGGVFDVETPYQKIAGVASAFFTAPFLTRPVLALRGGGEKLYGSFPYFDAAFIGGSRSLRTEHRQRFAGDASLFGTTELRVPIASFPLLLPWNVGALGFVDVARVYVDGDSPGGWHQGTGAGIWIAVVRPDIGITIVRTNNPDRRTLTSIGFAF